MQQIVDLQNDPDFQSLGVALVSIAADSTAEMAPEAAAYGINVPMLSDPDTSVSAAYDILKYALANGEPSHTFVLVSQDGQIIWTQDYGAPDNPNRTMYVPVDEIVGKIKSSIE